MKSPWKRLLNIVERIDGTPCEDLVDCPDVLIDLNCWLMDHEELSARVADAAPDLLAACKSALALLQEQVELVCGVGFEPPPDLNAENDEIMRLQAAIAKAERKET